MNDIMAAARTLCAITDAIVQPQSPAHPDMARADMELAGIAIRIYALLDDSETFEAAPKRFLATRGELRVIDKITGKRCRLIVLPVEG